MRLIFRLRLNRSLVRIPLQKFIEKEMNYWGQPTLIRPRYEPIFDHYTRQKQQKTERTSVISDCSVLNTLIFNWKYFSQSEKISSIIAIQNFFTLLLSSNAVGMAVAQPYDFASDFVRSPFSGSALWFFFLSLIHFWNQNLRKKTSWHWKKFHVQRPIFINRH